MKVLLGIPGTVGVTFAILLGFAMSVHAHDTRTTDFAFFDNTNLLTSTEGIQCSAKQPFEYHITVSEFTATANVLKVTYADGDFVRFKIAADGTQQISGFARGGTANPDNNFPDRCITICAETVSSLAGQMSVKTDINASPLIKCRNIVCGAAGLAPACPSPF
jgi:hypothetical protein